MTNPPAVLPSRGKPAAYGHEIVKRRHRRTLKKSAPAGKMVLDFGCGNGAQTLEFARDQCRIIAFDVDLADLQAFSRQLRSANVSSILPVQYGGGSLPVADASVDIVLCYEVIEHVPDEEKALSEIHRVLKPGGELIISVPNKAWIFETHGARLPVLPWNRVPFFSWLPKSIHQRFANARIYRRSEIIALLQRNSLKPQSSEYITAPMDVVSIGWLKKFLQLTVFTGDTTPVPFFSTSILVHCVKPS